MMARSVQVKVQLLDGSSTDYNAGDVKRGVIRVKDVIHHAHKMSGMDGEYEEKLFSLYSYEKAELASKELKQKVFLDARKSSRKLIDHFYTEEAKNNSVWTFSYGVKFYLRTSEIERGLQTEKARWLYYLQLCDDIKERKILLKHDTTETMNSCITLTSLMLRASQKSPVLELVPKENQPTNYSERLENAKIEDTKVSEMEPAKAVLEFIKLVAACDPDYYGKHLFLAREQQKHHGDSEELVTIGNSRDGITIYSDEVAKKHIPWENITRIAYRRNRFRIKCFENSEGSESGDKKPKRVKLQYCGGAEGRRQQAKWIWKNAVEQHAFPRVEHPGSRETIFHRRTSFRYSGPNTDKYVIKQKEDQRWEITDNPPDNWSLKKVEKVRVDVIKPIGAAQSIQLEIRQDESGMYHLIMPATGT